jgi:histidinol-phosphatase (PHP family)
VIIDYHLHLRDGKGEIAHTADAVLPFLETAASRGVDEIGLTEHVYYFAQTREVWETPDQLGRCRYDLDTYCDAVLEAKRQGFPVKLGLEVDYVGERQERLSELLEPYPWDFLLGSVHWLDGEAIDTEPGLWRSASVDEVWRRYMDALRQLATSGAVDVLAHPDLAKIFGRRPDPAALTELHLETADAIAAGDVCVEISTAGLRKPVREVYPDQAFLDACVGRGVAVTLASDAHEPRLVGEDFELALAAARQAGSEQIAVFDGRKRRLEPLG